MAFEGVVTITGKSKEALVIDMYYIRGLSQVEIAKILEISQSTVSRILNDYRAKVLKK